MLYVATPFAWGLIVLELPVLPVADSPVPLLSRCLARLMPMQGQGTIDWLRRPSYQACLYDPASGLGTSRLQTPVSFQNAWPSSMV
jgi:hypothetical protein